MTNPNDALRDRLARGIAELVQMRKRYQVAGRRVTPRSVMVCFHSGCS